MSDLNCPIGVFDSGLGGLSVLPAIKKLLPFESLLYFGDSARAPYGIRTPEEVRQLSYAVCDHLMSKGAKAIVVACNTATSAAVAGMRKRYPVPIIGMEPALKPAIEQTETGPVAVLATELTLKEDKFRILLDRFGKTHDILQIPCPQLVELVERGITFGPEAEAAVLSCFDGIDIGHMGAVVLGCTHFVFLRGVFQALLPGVPLIDGNEGTARQLKRKLTAGKLLNPAREAGRVVIENSGGAEYVERSWALLNNMMDHS